MAMATARDLVVYFWRRRLWYLIPLALIVPVLGAGARAARRVGGSATPARKVGEPPARGRLQQQIEAEGRQLYPLW